MRATSTAVVPASVQQVWDVLSNHEGMSKWGPGLSVTLTHPGKPERNGLGAVRRVSLPGPAPAIVEEVIAFDAPSRLGYRALSGVPFRNYAGDVRLIATQTGTEIVYTVSADKRLPVLDKVEQLVLKAIAAGLLTALVQAVKRSA